MNANVIFLVNFVTTWYLVGLIWMVQCVHYKLFDRVGGEEFVPYETAHANLITPIVGPPMLIEIATAGLLVAFVPPLIPRWVLVAAFIAVVAIWLSTAFIQVPCHTRLTSNGFTRTDYQLLVGSNWIRTILWTARGFVLAYFASKLMG